MIRLQKPEKIGKTIRDRRKARGWSQKQLAERLGAPGMQMQVSLWERGKVVPTMESLARLANLFGANDLSMFIAPDDEPLSDYLTGDDEVDELIRSMVQPTALRVYGRAKLTPSLVLDTAKEIGREYGWSPEKISRLNVLLTILERSLGNSEVIGG